MLTSEDLSMSFDALHYAPYPSECSIHPPHAGYKQDLKHIIVVTGPSGCGKSTVAQYLSSLYNYVYLEGDNFHPATNIEKMAAKIALKDADRWDWLIALRKAAVRELATGARGVIMTCSALKSKYRDVLRIACLKDRSVRVHFLLLSADEQTLVSRVAQRKEHFMSADMVRSQLADLEPPTEKERDIIQIDVGRSIQEVEASLRHDIQSIF